MKEYRLQKIIAQSGILSRRKADQIVKEGRVSINGKKAILGDKADPENDSISIDGISLPKRIDSKVILLNKPSGYICTCKDPHGRKTIFNLIPKRMAKGLHPVGRLDCNSRGAILLTNNGELTLKLTHPKFSHIKTYLVCVSGIPNNSTIKHWREGVALDGRKTIPSSIELLKTYEGNSLLEVKLREGRNRQIRRIAELVGHPVIDLKRISISSINLNNLQEGKWRLLKKTEWIDIIR